MFLQNGLKAILNNKEQIFSSGTKQAKATKKRKCEWIWETIQKHGGKPHPEGLRTTEIPKQCWRWNILCELEENLPWREAKRTT